MYNKLYFPKNIKELNKNLENYSIEFQYISNF